MKLRNKKTGQEGDFIINEDHFECVSLDYVPEYRNIAELTEEWEDYEKPKNQYYLDCDGRIFEHHTTEYIKNKMKEIGNYFETKEEAEKAVEKLKAWKRLKDKGFRFETWGWDDEKDNRYTIWFELNDKEGDCSDLNLLFGGEE